MTQSRSESMLRRRSISFCKSDLLGRGSPRNVSIFFFLQQGHTEKLMRSDCGISFSRRTTQRERKASLDAASTRERSFEDSTNREPLGCSLIMPFLSCDFHLLPSIPRSRFEISLSGEKRKSRLMINRARTCLL